MSDESEDRSSDDRGGATRRAGSDDGARTADGPDATDRSDRESGPDANRENAAGGDREHGVDDDRKQGAGAETDEADHEPSLAGVFGARPEDAPSRRELVPESPSPENAFFLLLGVLLGAFVIYRAVVAFGI